MKSRLFPRLAWLGIRKNYRLYVPYILSCVGMVMMFFLLQSLSCSPVLQRIEGGGGLEMSLTLGRFVIAAFAVIFLFYTNSFLIRRRFREFGLYNVLGMDKRGISRVIGWESLFVALIALVGGLVLGIALAKAAELGMLRAIRAEVDFSFSLSAESITFTAAVFGVIFLLLSLRSLRQVRRSDPLALLRSEAAGEKPPRGNTVLALVGAALLIAAYVLAVTIESPITALVVFFVAVLMVIAATYLLFISGSVTLCRRLQKNTRYYYRKAHFVSVSTMTYRMKRNGAGLASICILCTMVLVILSSTTSLFFGGTASVERRYPREFSFDFYLPSLDMVTEENADQLHSEFAAELKEQGLTAENEISARYAKIAALLEKDGYLEPNRVRTPGTFSPDAVRDLTFLTAADYTRETGVPLTLREGEAAILAARGVYDFDTLRIGDLTLTVKERLTEMPDFFQYTISLTPSFLVVIPDWETLRPLAPLRDPVGDKMLVIRWVYCFDVDAGSEVIFDTYEGLSAGVFRNLPFLRGEKGELSYRFACRSIDRADFLVSYGSLFFVGILLSIVFLFAAAMIIYYKQLSEGYEDRARFAILQKVGMTPKEIKKSIDSQVLTVFFAPLLTAGVHLCFAFPLLWRMLQLFNLDDLRLVILVTAASFIGFAAIYAVLYKLTARTYYHIVSSPENG